MDLFDKVKDRIEKAADKLPRQLGDLRLGLETTLNPNHRHDQADEQQHDAMQTAVRESHRFQSFAREREGNDVKWFIDGHDNWWAISEILEGAREVICIQGWWLTPELYLRRPPANNERWRLDRILKRKAEQGVKIYVIVYKEVAKAATMNSAHTKHFLEDLHTNIAVMRHPDHWQGERTLLWSHHQKVVLVDNTVACIGGLDLCFGRWDTHSHPLADAFIRDFRQTMFPGQDYNDARIKDFTDVEKWTSNLESRLEIPRMPWHDVHSMLVGPVVMDIAQHFCERWNFIRTVKYGDKGGRYPVLAFPHTIPEGHNDNEHDSQDHEPVTRHPHFHHWRKIGTQYFGHETRQEDGGPPFGGRGPKGNMKVQVVRSCGDWSNGTLTEQSVMNAYIQLIRESNHFIYIENQFFVTACAEGGPVKNRIGAALAERIISAARNNQSFKIVVVIPAIPGFAGDLSDTGSASTAAIMDATYKSICRGERSIFETVRKAGYDASRYISFYNLRSYDRINNDPGTIRYMEQQSGVTYYETQAAIGRIYLGDGATKKEIESNKVVVIKLAQEGESIEGHPTLRATEGGVVEATMPESIEEAREMLRKFSAAAPPGDRRVADTLAWMAMQCGGDLWQAGWLGDEASEKAAFVTEELYIHSKLMIVDDCRVIIGSANLNDRSMMGDRDSEIAIVIEDENMVESRMNGEKYYASQFASSFRRQLYKEHLGLLSPQPPVDRQQHEPSGNTRPVGVPHDPTDEAAEQAVEDPFAVHQLLEERARLNAECFARIFHCVPAKGIMTWAEYKDYVPKKPNKVAHIYSPELGLQEIKETLGRIRGHIVEMPLDFIAKDPMYEESPVVNPLTMEVYV